MKQLKITFKDGSTETFTQNELTYFTVDTNTRIVYVVYPKIVVRIPFESVKMIEESREDEQTR